MPNESKLRRREGSMIPPSEDYFAWARTYEKEALGSPDHTVQLVKRFADGNAVTIEGTGSIRLRWATRLFRSEHLLYVVIAAFAVVYVYLVSAALIGCTQNTTQLSMQQSARRCPQLNRS